MSDSKKKLSHIRTFAGDMKQQQAHGTSTDAKKTASEITPDAAKPTPLPVKQSYTPNSTQKEKSDDAKDSNLNKTPANPPFHKLHQKSNTGKTTPQTLQDSAASITDHPESILNDKKKKHFSVSDDGSTSATIVSDTKHARKSVLHETIISFKNWVKRLKNTYITPPKPSYTVNRAERRAGVLQNATPKTGVSHVEHDTVADRIRNRYTKQENNSHLYSDADNTDPVFLPSLPPGRDTVAAATDVTVKPRRDGTQTTQKNKQDETPAITAEQTTPMPEVSDKNSAQADKPASTEATTQIPTEVSPDTKKETVPQNESQESHEKSSNIQTLQREDKTISSHQTTDKTVGAPSVEKPQNQRVDTTANESVKPKTEQSGDVKHDTPIKNIAEPLPDGTASIPSDFRKEYEIAVARANTNRLSLRIVGVGIGCILVAIASYNTVPLLLSGDSPEAVSTIAGSDTHILMVDRYGSSAARFAALRTILDTHSSTITHVTPHRTTQSQQPIPITGQAVVNAFSLNLPSTIIANLNTIHFGDHQNYDRFIYMDIQNERESFGAMLDWEATLPNDLAVWFEVRSGGTFRDETILDYDARVFRDNDGVAQLIYTIVDGYIIITTRPTVLESLVLSHQ